MSLSLPRRCGISFQDRAPVTPDIAQVEQTIVEFTNAFRRQSERGALRRNPTLDQAARSFARYLARTGKFSHTADGRQPADRTQEAGYKHCRVSENLALNMDTRGFRARALARAAIEGWKKSPPHRRAMVDPFVTEIGVGVAKADNEQRYLSVQLFGRPRALQYRFTIRNTSRRLLSYTHGEESHVLGGRTEVVHTACQPARLKIRDARPRGRAKGQQSVYQTRHDDTFVIRAQPDGALIVDHRPRTN
jgi:uncharacterized protein YkwD